MTAIRMKIIVAISMLLFVWSLNAADIVYQYWFDGDVANKYSGTVPLVSDIATLSSLDVNALPDGPHTVHIRFKDENTKWTSLYSKAFLKDAGSQQPTRLLNGYEYWFDNDLASKIWVPIDPKVENFTLPNVSVSHLADGVHTVHFRFKNDQGEYSTMFSKAFVKETVIVQPTRLISGYEYWLDGDRNNLTYVPVNPHTENFTLSSLDMSQLSNGTHSIFTRFRNNIGEWTGILSYSFLKEEIINTPDRYLKRLRYWFNNDFAGAQIVMIPGQDLETYNLQNLPIDKGSLAPGNHEIHLQVGNSENEWGGVFTDSFEVPNGPDAPTGIVVTQVTTPSGANSFDELKVQWTDASTNETGFEIVRSTSSGGNFDVAGIVIADADHFIDKDLNQGVQYFYKVRALSSIENSAYTAEGSGTTNTVDYLTVNTNTISTDYTYDVSGLGVNVTDVIAGGKTNFTIIDPAPGNIILDFNNSVSGDPQSVDIELDAQYKIIGVSIKDGTVYYDMDQSFYRLNSAHEIEFLNQDVDQSTSAIQIIGVTDLVYEGAVDLEVLGVQEYPYAALKIYPIDDLNNPVHEDVAIPLTWDKKDGNGVDVAAGTYLLEVNLNSGHAEDVFKAQIIVE